MTVPVARYRPKANAFFPQIPLMLWDGCVFGTRQDRSKLNRALRLRWLNSAGQQGEDEWKNLQRLAFPAIEDGR